MTSRVGSEEITTLIDTGTTESCLAFFARMPEKERRAYAKQASKKFKDAHKTWLGDFGVSAPKAAVKTIEEIVENARICVLATATRSELKKLGWQALPRNESLLNVMQALKPTWIDDWVEDITESQRNMFNDIRLLYSAGLCKKPTGEGYILGMMEALPRWRTTPEQLWPKDMPLAERIRSTPDIRDQDIWRLFEVEGGGDRSLATLDKYAPATQGGWASALIELSDDGTLSRARLLDCSLDALARDFAQFRSGWFSRFHESLVPTLEERSARRDQYLRLLASTNPPTVSFALKAIGILDKADRLPPEVIVDYIEPVLSARAKSAVLIGLRLLVKVAKHRPDQSGELALLATQALIHESSDVQKKSLDLIESLPGTLHPDTIEAMQAYAEGIAPSLRGRFSDCVGNSLPQRNVEIDQPAIAPEAVEDLEPITSFEEMHHAFLQVMEDPSNPMQVERLLGGIASYGNEKPADFKKIIGPLRKRSEAIVERQPDDGIQYQVALLGLAYARNEDLVESKSTRYASIEIGNYYSSGERTTQSFESVFFHRNAQLIKQLQQGVDLHLLSTPGDNRGFVSAKTLLERYRQYKDQNAQPAAIDQTLALLRIAPEGRKEIIDLLDERDEFESALLFALGGRLKIGRTGWLWVAAAAARLPYSDQPEIAKKHGHGYPDAGSMAKYGLSFEKHQYYTSLTLSVLPTMNREPPNLYLSSFFHITTAGSTRYGSICGHHVNMIRWSSTVWPLNLEAFFSQGLAVFQCDQPLANSPYAAFIEPMLLSHVQIGDNGAGLILHGLASTDSAVKALALEATISAIEQNRLNSECLESSLATLLPTGCIPVGRWTKSFSELASVSSQHANFVRNVISGSLRHNPADAPRDIGGLLELLFELCVDTAGPVIDMETVRYLTGIQGGGKPKKFARKLLAFDPN